MVLLIGYFNMKCLCLADLAQLIAKNNFGLDQFLSFDLFLSFLKVFYYRVIGLSYR
jgi:hypothetical protein